MLQMGTLVERSELIGGWPHVSDILPQEVERSVWGAMVASASPLVGGK